MTGNWKKYEDEVYEECCRIYGSEYVERNVSRVGVYTRADRQIDVLVHTDEGDIAFDAKYYSKHVDVKTIESMIGMYGDLGVSKFVVVTNKGYSKNALRRAHMGTENVEADVMNMGELSRFQDYGALSFAGRNGVVLSSPFGWVIDGQISVHPGMPAVLYARGLSNDDVYTKKEFAYVGFWDKEDEINTVQQLMEHHREECLEGDENGDWSIIENTPFYIARYTHSAATVVEYFGYKEFDNFIFYVVLLCEEERWSRNRQKLVYLLEHAKPFNVVHHDQMSEMEIK